MEGSGFRDGTGKERKQRECRGAEAAQRRRMPTEQAHAAQFWLVCCTSPRLDRGMRPEQPQPARLGRKCVWEEKSQETPLPNAEDGQDSQVPCPFREAGLAP